MRKYAACHVVFCGDSRSLCRNEINKHKFKD